MEKAITLTVNGHTHAVTSDPQRPLLDVLREDLHLTGTKYGCGEGQCRACTVLIEGKAVPSCVTPISQAEGKEVLTIEGLAKGAVLHPVQQAFLDAGASQCGYCTSGMILGIVGLLNEMPRPTAADLRSGMQRHICRCCNYPKILRAFELVANGRSK